MALSSISFESVTGALEKYVTRPPAETKVAATFEANTQPNTFLATLRLLVNLASKTQFLGSTRKLKVWAHKKISDKFTIETLINMLRIENTSFQRSLLEHWGKAMAAMATIGVLFSSLIREYSLTDPRSLESVRKKIQSTINDQSNIVVSTLADMLDSDASAVVKAATDALLALDISGKGIVEPN